MMMIRPLRLPQVAIYPLAQFDPVVRRALAEQHIPAPPERRPGHPSPAAQSKIIDALNGGLSTSEKIADRLGSSRGRVNVSLHYLKDRGAVRAVRQGHRVVWLSTEDPS